MVRSNDRTIERDNHLGLITINRPTARNALTPEIIQGITASIRELEQRDDVKLIGITGAGGQAFAAGCDVGVINDMNRADVERFMASGNECADGIERCSKPVIALVNGYALGGGFELVLACDLIFATHDASFGFPEVKLGLIPGFGGTQRLPRCVGLSRAKELIFTGTIVSAKRAYEWGLINRLVAPTSLYSEAITLAQELAAVSSSAISAAKQAMNNRTAERDAFLRCFEDPDSREGLTAFLHKRSPRFM